LCATASSHTAASLGVRPQGVRAKHREFEQNTASCLNTAQGGKGMPPGVPFECFQPSTATGDWTAWEDQGDPHILQKASALEQALLCYLAEWDTSHEDCQPGGEALRADAPVLTEQTAEDSTEATLDCVPSGSECNAIGAVCCNSQETCFDAGGVACPHNPGESCLCQAAPSCSPECGAHGNCSAHNKCECEPNWTGDRCEITWTRPASPRAASASKRRRGVLHLHRHAAKVERRVVRELHPRWLGLQPEWPRPRSGARRVLQRRRLHRRLQDPGHG